MRFVAALLAVMFIAAGDPPSAQDAASIEPALDAHGWQQAYAVIDGPEYEIVGRSEFAWYVRHHYCGRIERRRYPKIHLVEWHCYV